MIRNRKLTLLLCLHLKHFEVGLGELRMSGAKEFQALIVDERKNREKS
jgi:hypothetical protein